MNSSKRCDLDDSAHNTTITEKLMVNHGNQERAILGYGKKFRRKDKFINMYIVFGLLVCCLKGIWLHPYTITLAKLALDLGIQVHLRIGNDVMTSCSRLISTTDHFTHP